MLGHVGIGAGDEDAEVGVVRLRRPHLLPVDDPLVAVEHGPGGQGGQVAAGARLAEQLAPQLVAPQQRPEVALLLLAAAVAHDRRADQLLRRADEPGGHVEALGLLPEDDALAGRRPPPAEGLGPGDAGPPVVVEGGLPLLAPAQVVELGLLALGAGASRPVGVGARLQRGVGLEEGSDLGPERGFGGGVVEIHGWSPPAAGTAPLDTRTGSRSADQPRAGARPDPGGTIGAGTRRARPYFPVVTTDLRTAGRPRGRRPVDPDPRRRARARPLVVVTAMACSGNESERVDLEHPRRSRRHARPPAPPVDCYTVGPGRPGRAASRSPSAPSSPSCWPPSRRPASAGSRRRRPTRSCC